MGAGEPCRLPHQYHLNGGTYSARMTLHLPKVQSARQADFALPMHAGRQSGTIHLYCLAERTSPHL